MKTAVRYIRNANLKLKRMIEMPAVNWRFGVMAAVTPQKRQCKFESLSPAGSVVEAATTPSRWDVGCNAARASSRKCTEKNM